MISALIITHGKLGQELLHSVEQVIGPQSDVRVLSNDGMSLEQITDSVEAEINGNATFLFVDSCGGSPYVACKCVRAAHESCAVITGINFPMLLSFFTKREKLNFRELVEVVKADGLRGIQALSE